MRKLRNILIAVAAGTMLSGCGIYNKYEQKTETPQNVFGTHLDVADATGGESLAQLSWREFFTDPQLRQLIEQVLANNTDLFSARIAIQKSEAALKAARLAYLPSLAFTPQGALSKFDNYPWTKTYNLQLNMSWDIDLFGSITNKKRAAKAVLFQSQVSEESTRANLISITAQQYYMLQLLDRELEILMLTDSLWNKSLETEKSLWENGKAYSTAVNQMEASYINVKTQIIDVKRSIRFVENDICSLLGITSQHIERSKWSDALLHNPQASGDTGQRMFDTKYLTIGVPAQMIELRPDIRLLNYAMEEAFYNTQAARSAFYPSLTLSGALGWTNSGGGVITNPGKLLFEAVGSLTQPIFQRGKLTANLKTAKLSEENLKKKYVQAIIDAGNDVNEAIADCTAAREKFYHYRRQVEVLNDAFVGTHELMDNGKASYLEVLTAQESLLSAQLDEAENMYDGAKAVISLYIALGGATK